jgi:hypothetical protein
MVSFALQPHSCYETALAGMAAENFSFCPAVPLIPYVIYKLFWNSRSIITELYSDVVQYGWYQKPVLA